MLPGIATATQLLAASTSPGGGGGVSGTARQVSLVSPGFGLVDLNSGSTVRQTELPGVAVNEGR